MTKSPKLPKVNKPFFFKKLSVCDISFESYFSFIPEGNFFGVITKGKSSSLQWRGGVVIDSLESVKSWIKHINPQLSGTLHSAQT